MTPRALVITFIVVAFLGFLDAAYLTANYFLGTAPACFIAQGCDVVTTSVYSRVLDVPVALLGSLYYLAMFFAGLYLLESKNARFARFLPYFTATGLLVSIWLIYAQIALIKALCVYCLLSALTSTALFILSFPISKKLELQV
ncbi:vitamin K epoxide reductase family protein [Patescibacteria group bacterium]|nr:MAG: vitamin K epoxide reductase family protein [Patescibacteria group bacterium]